MIAIAAELRYSETALLFPQPDRPLGPARSTGSELIVSAFRNPGGAAIRTGTFWGPVEITVDTLDGPPETGSRWDAPKTSR